MKRLILIFLILFSALCKAQKDSVRYELYVRCCMGEVKPNDFNLLYHVYKDTTYICNTDFDYQITLPDTGCYLFENMDQSKGDSFIRCFEHGGLYRDTFDIYDDITYGLLIIDEGNNKVYTLNKWQCNGCDMDGYLKRTFKSGALEWEGLYKKGKRIWYKSYDENGNLIYHTKRNFWGKEKVIIDKRMEAWHGRKKEDEDK